MKNLINYLSKKSLSLGNGPALDRRWTGHESGRFLSILTLFLTLFSFGVGNAWGTPYFTDDFSDVGNNNSACSSRSGWGSFTRVYNHYNSAIRLASGSNTGSVTKTVMKEIGASPTTIVLRFAAKSYNADGSELNIVVNNAGTANNTNFILRKETSTTSSFSFADEDYFEVIISNATSSTTITFNAASGKRVFLGDVSIYPYESEGKYVLVEDNGDIEAGDYLIVYNNANALNKRNSGNWDTNQYGSYTSISSYYTSSTKSIASNTTTDGLAYHVKATTNGYYIRKKSSGGFLGNISNNTGNYLQWNRELTTSNNEWTLGVNSIVSVRNSSYAIRWNSGFKIYAPGNQSAVQLFKKVTCTGINPSVSYSSTTIYKGDITSAPTITGNTGSAGITWTSSNTDVATVSSTGVVTALKAGTTTIKASFAASGDYCAKDVSINFTVRYRVKWSVNGDDSYEAGSPSLYVEANGKIATFPTSPAKSACDGSKEFVGWTASPIVGTTDSKPTFVSPQTGITDNTTLYAVFATRTANSYSLGDINDLVNGKNVIVYNANQDKAMASSIQATGKLAGLSVTFSSTNITSPDASLIWTITNSGEKYIFKNSSGNYLRVTSSSSNTNLTCDGTSDTWTITEVSTGVYSLYSTAGSSTYPLEAYYSSPNYFFTSYKGSGANFNMKFYVPTYSAYVTTCCTPLGSINGSISLTQGGNSVTISGWTYDNANSTTESNVSSYTVKLYKKNGASWDLVSGTAANGSAGTAGTRTDIATNSKSVTYTGLVVESEYKFTIQAIGTGNYCSGDETAVTEINSTDVSSTPFKFRYAIYIDDGTNDNYEYHYITSTGNTDEGSVDIDLSAHVDYYQFKIAGGFSGWWGQTGTSKIPASTEWELDGSNNVRLESGAGGSYTFTVDYSSTNPAVTVTFPSADQSAGYVIYYDNSILNWSSLYYRIGNNSTNSNQAMTLVTGTDNFYKVTTPAYPSMDAWHIANNYGWAGSGNSIYKTKTNAEQASIAITNSISFQQAVVTENITVIPTTTHSTGGDDQNNNCQFYTINTPTSGMLTHNVAVSTAAHGTLVATYTNTSGTTGQTVTEGNDADLAHRCILTITATPDDGYTCTSLTLNGDAFTSGNTHILTADATIAATFTANKYDVTLKPTSQTGSVTDQVVQATYDAAMPTTVKTAGTAIVIPERTGYSFTGWFDNSSGGKQYYQYTGSPKTLSSANAWDKTSATNLYAQWSINSYTLTWATVRGKVTTAGTGAAVNATGNVSSSQEYNTELTAPVCGSANGYTFTGWSPTPASNMPAENTTYTAQWSANVYTVTLDNQSATTAGAASVSATFGQAMPSIASNLPAKTGYRFDGYYTAKNGGGTKYYNADGSSATNMAMYSANPKLYANWVAQLTFSVNGAIDGTLTRDVTENLPSSATVPTSCGDCWAFAGWDASSTCSITPGHAGGEDAATHGITTPTTLYAVFSKAEYKLIKSTSDLVANDNYVLTIVNSGSEYAMSNEAQASYEYEIARTDVTSSLRENADGYFLYNVSANNIWKFTGTSSSGQLYNAAADKYLNLSSTAGSSTSMLNTTDNLTFSVDGIYWTIHGTKYLHPYSVYGGGWEATSSGSWDADEDFSGFLYHQTSAMYATEPECETYDIVWKVGNTSLTSGDQTEETNTCAGIEELPEDPDDDALDCAKKFMGWSEEELVGVGHDAPADLFTSVGDAPAIDEDKTFHAVFATTIGTPIAAIEDTEFSSSDESGGYGSATYSFKAANKYLQKQSIWTSSNMTNVKVKIRVYHFSNSKADVLRVSLINSSGTEVVGADLSTSHFGSNISGGGYSDYVELTPTTAVTGYKVSMKTLNSSGTGISKIEREVVASGFKDYVTMCCDYIVTLSDGSPSNGSVTFDPVGPIETCTAAKEVSMTITPDPGYYLSAWTSSGVAPSRVEPAVITNTANAQTTTVTFAKETTEGTYTAGATFSAKALEGWTWMYKKDADAADDAVDPYAIPEVVELYKDQYARFIITGYTPADVIADKQGYVYSVGGVEPAYSTDYLTYVSKNGSAPYSYYQLKGKAPTESTTITFKAVGDASITKTVTIRVKALPLAHFVDNVHNESFADVVATVSTGVVTLTKQTPTHADFTGSALNTCEETHLHLIGWIDGDWAPYAAYMAGTGDKPTISAITGATGYFYAPNADIDLVAKNGHTYYAVWAQVE